MSIKKTVIFIFSLVFAGLMAQGLFKIMCSMEAPGFAPVLLLVLFALSLVLGAVGSVFFLMSKTCAAVLLTAGIIGAAAAALTAYLSLDMSVAFISAIIGAAGMIVISRLPEAWRSIRP
jgi:hypothetical protein